MGIERGLIRPERRKNIHLPYAFFFALTLSVNYDHTHNKIMSLS